MKLQVPRNVLVCSAAAWISALGAAHAANQPAAVPQLEIDAEYTQALKFADQYVQKKKAQQVEPGQVPANLLRLLPSTVSSSSAVAHGRALDTQLNMGGVTALYRIGDRWQVAAFKSNPVSEISGDGRPHGHSGTVGIFEYTVIEAKPELVTFDVKQIEAYGVKKADPSVAELHISMDRSGRQTAKSYRFEGQSEFTPASADGLRADFTALEMYPLDIPNLVTADALAQPAPLPELPAQLQKVASQANAPVPTANWVEFEQSDFFGRPIQMFWQKGGLWPSYLKTPQGVSVLIKPASRSAAAQGAA